MPRSRCVDVEMPQSGDQRQQRRDQGTAPDGLARIFRLAFLRGARGAAGHESNCPRDAAEALRLFAINFGKFRVGQPPNLLAVALVDDFPGAQPDHAVGIALHEIEIMQAANDGAPVVAVEFFEIAHNRVRQHRVEAGNGFVGEDQLRVLHQRPRDADALLLPAAQFVGADARLALDADALQRIHRPLLVGFGEVVA